MANENVEKPAEETTVSLETLFPKEEANKPAAKSTETDVKEKETPSSGEEDKPSEEDEDSLVSKVTALQKELGRVRRNKNESADEVQGLREQLARVQGQLETLVRTGGEKSETQKMAKYTDAQLVQGQTEWEDELLTAHELLRDARKGDDERKLDEAGKRVQTAKQTIAAIRQELLERTKRVGADQAKAQTEANKIVEEVVDLYNNAYESFPELKDKESAIWQASNEEFTARPSLMKQLGPLGELVAVALAITANPDLVGGKKKAQAARKELLSEINDKAETALLKVGGKSTKRATPNFEEMKADDFEQVVSKIKMGR